MFIRQYIVAFLAAATIFANFAVIGCSGQAASVRQEQARSLAASAVHPTVASVAKTTQPFAKPAPRDYLFASYSDPEFGASFRYPRNFALLDSSEENADSDRVISWEQAKQAGTGIRTSEELSLDDPGASLLATIVVPDDAYPNTSFAGGSLQFAINRYQTAGTCRSNLLARQGDAKGPSGVTTTQGVSFAWIDIDTGDGSTEFYERDYAGFANDACYEFFVRIGVKSPASDDAALQNVSTAGAAPDGGSGSSVTGEESPSSRRPDERKILAHLEKIVASLQVEKTSASVLDKPQYKSAPTFPASN